MPPAEGIASGVVVVVWWRLYIYYCWRSTEPFKFYNRVRAMLEQYQ